eukprot:CAMPEP_0194137488 /NCGR_PEP_ID=MMETSP0152-20130528/7375_1 /TAXON_ID=1049557 /ORGANISM="Thalassiothrix antarctica, Strain L6-D1" /LENGTH=674 /DNA_ID=CAMNT_0038834527 /DNA_START=449 /DNA_END=2473 /DNA_ORIENTATION=-
MEYREDDSSISNNTNNSKNNNISFFSSLMRIGNGEERKDKEKLAITDGSNNYMNSYINKISSASTAFQKLLMFPTNNTNNSSTDNKKVDNNDNNTSKDEEKKRKKRAIFQKLAASSKDGTLEKLLLSAKSDANTGDDDEDDDEKRKKAVFQKLLLSKGGGGTSKRWRNMKTKIRVVNSAIQQKVNIENKIGTPAAELDSSDPLRKIAMSSERALRQFGKEYSRHSGSRVRRRSSKDMDSSIFSVDESVISSVGDESVTAGGSYGRLERQPYDNNDRRYFHNKSKRRNSNSSWNSNTTIHPMMEQNRIQFHASKYTMDRSTSFVVPQPSFECYDLCPTVFSDIRKSFRILDSQYYAILGLQNGRRESTYSVISSKDAAGKSSSFFFLSSDQRFILKSCTAQDVQTLCKILPKYRDYVVKQQEQHHSSRSKDETTNEEKAGAACGTLLPRYLGLYTLKFPDNTELPDVTLIVMVNFFASIHKVDTKFDLKGSSYHRVASEKERSKKQPVYKDNDWISMGKKLTFPTEQMKASIHTQLQMDTAFLTRHNLMDYSLLVGIHDLEHDDDTTKMEDSSTISECMGVISCCTRKEIRYFGIIDILTEYGLLKQLETFFTGYFICEPTTISCQPPHKYAARFCDFAQQHILHTDSGARLSVYAVDQQPLSEEEDDLDQSPLP